jgi:NADH-quinone oxidoreductase subunit D
MAMRQLLDAHLERISRDPEGVPIKLYPFTRRQGRGDEPKAIEMIRHFLREIPKAIRDMERLLNRNRIFVDRTKGIGVLSREAAIDYCAVGPTARASGIARDVRKNSPYGAYDQVDWNMIVTENGDVFDKVLVRISEMFESIKILKACLTRLPGGEIDCLVKEVPPGEGIGHIEAPRGECFHYVRSDGTNRPARHKIRAPTFMNLPTFRETVIGGKIPDAAITLAAIDPCYCCTERMAVRNLKGRKLYTGEDLIRLSQEKTDQIKAEMGR